MNFANAGILLSFYLSVYFLTLLHKNVNLSARLEKENIQVLAFYILCNEKLLLWFLPSDFWLFFRFAIL